MVTYNGCIYTNKISSSYQCMINNTIIPFATTFGKGTNPIILLSAMSKQTEQTGPFNFSIATSLGVTE